MSYTRKVLIAAGISIGLALLALLFVTGFHVLLLAFAASLLVIFFLGIAEKIQSIVQLGPVAARVIAVLLVVILAVGTGIVLGARIAEQVDTIEQQFSKAIDSVARAVPEGGLIGGWIQRVRENPQEFLQGQGKRVASFFSSTLGVLSEVFIMLVVALFFFATPSEYRNGIIKLIPPERRERGEEIVGALYKYLKLWILGKGAAMVAVAIMTTVGLSILGVPLALTLGLLAGLLSFIPNIGPLLSMVPGALMAFTVGPTTVLIVIGLYIGIQLLESNVLTPLIQRNMVKVPAALIFLTQVLMGLLVGGLGLIFATPLLVAVLVLVRMLYVEGALGDDAKLS